MEGPQRTTLQTLEQKIRAQDSKIEEEALVTELQLRFLVISVRLNKASWPIYSELNCLDQYLNHWLTHPWSPLAGWVYSYCCLEPH